MKYLKWSLFGLSTLLIVLLVFDVLCLGTIFTSIFPALLLIPFILTFLVIKPYTFFFEKEPFFQRPNIAGFSLIAGLSVFLAFHYYEKWENELAQEKADKIFQAVIEFKNIEKTFPDDLKELNIDIETPFLFREKRYEIQYRQLENGHSFEIMYKSGLGYCSKTFDSTDWYCW